jgi:hypothetical protein
MCVGLTKLVRDSVTTMFALVALHIETAFSPSETDLDRSMASNSINQIMLLLTHQGKELPAVIAALPLLRRVLSQKCTSLVSDISKAGHSSSATLCWGPVGVPDEDRMEPISSTSEDITGSFGDLSQPYSEEYDGQNALQALIEAEFLGYDLFGDWQTSEMP